MSFKTQLPCLHFPTTITVVDDNANYLSFIRAKIENILACKAFSDPKAALNFINSTQKNTSLIDRCFNWQEDDDINRRKIEIDINAIHREIYNPKRFDEPSVLVVDFAMPGLNGAELCQQLHSHPCKKILLTGEAGMETAIRLFNEGVIQQYIHKNDPLYLDKLLLAIQELQHRYFIDLSKPIINSITIKSDLFSEPASCLNDPTFINLFNQLLEQHQPAEYYLIDESGSFLFLSQKGKLSWLIVKTEEQMRSTEYDLELDPVALNDKLKEAIAQRKVLRHCFDNEAYPELDDIQGWENLFYPATILPGKTNYYYSYIETPLMNPILQKNNILHYNTYRNSIID